MGIVEAVPPNAPRSASGERRVRRSINLLPETAEALTATEAAVALDAMVAKPPPGKPLTPQEQGQRAAREGWDWARDAAMANLSAEDYGRFLDGWDAVKDGGADG